jgi:hypothetical protein
MSETSILRRGWLELNQLLRLWKPTPAPNVESSMRLMRRGYRIFSPEPYHAATGMGAIGAGYDPDYDMD